MSLPTLLAYATLLIAVPLNWLVVAMLWRVHRATSAAERAVIRERIVVAVAVAIIVTAFGLIFVNNDLVVPIVPFDETKLATRGVMFAASVVSPAYWLWIYR